MLNRSVFATTTLVKTVSKFGAVTCAIGLVLLLAGLGRGQGATTTQSITPPDTAASGTAVPRLIRFSGSVMDSAARAGSRQIYLMFSLYELQEGGSPLWAEAQTAQLDAQGRYTVLLGATQPDGIPLDLFISGKALWLGVEPQFNVHCRNTRRDYGQQRCSGSAHR
ncbi:MAG: hypothetical protein JOY62_09000 [Acidobacteriaceae bacterium]|nr:hypothetical protein [Acidobacteriaceae bacterium]MBV9780097.1 hypothetical protein [Acidobacteriaceae bacterium]